MRCPTLAELPSPPHGRTGWPWTEETPPLLGNLKLPLISIVTPSFNQGEYLEETIRSVLLQGYSNLEYIIMDGGSTDNSVEIITKYEKFITCWVSEEDSGQGNAINTGFQKSTGEILGWLNSDDFYLAGTLLFIAHSLDIDEAGLVFGNCQHFLDDGSSSWGSDVVQSHTESNLLLEDYIIQPSTFWTRKSWQLVGELDPGLNYAFDWDWFIRARKALVVFQAQSRYFSAYRFHSGHKTGVGGHRRLDELALIYKTYSGTHYEKLFRLCCRYDIKIKKVHGALRRLKLQCIEKWVLRVLVWPLWNHYSEEEIRWVLRMV